jgi:hypothetical protein
MNYQDRLTAARRDAYWRALERMRATTPRVATQRLAAQRPVADAWKAWRGRREAYEDWYGYAYKDRCDQRPGKVERSLLALTVLAMIGVVVALIVAVIVVAG